MEYVSSQTARNKQVDATALKVKRELETQFGLPPQPLVADVEKKEE